MKKVCVILGYGFEEIEGITQIDILRRAGITVDIYGVENGEITGSHEITVKTDKVLNKECDVNVEDYCGLIIPGGPGVWKLAENNAVLGIVKNFNAAKKFIFAICAAPLILDKAGVLEGRKFTCYPATAGEIKTGRRIDERVVVDGNIVTSQGVGTSLDAAIKLVEIIVSKEEAEKQKKKIVYHE